MTQKPSVRGDADVMRYHLGHSKMTTGVKLEYRSKTENDKAPSVISTFFSLWGYI